MTHLTFAKDNSFKGKTQLFLVYSIHDEALLGEIKWLGKWRQYVFHPEENCVWSWDCLKELSEFIKKLMDERKEGD